MSRRLEPDAARQSITREAQESWAEFQRTGLHQTGQEIRVWLDSWGGAAEIAPPECHR